MSNPPKKPFFPPKPATAQQIQYQAQQNTGSPNSPSYYTNTNYQGTYNNADLIFNTQNASGQKSASQHVGITQAVQNYSYGIQQPMASIPYKPATADTTGLYIASLDSWMDENFVYSLFAHTGEVVNVKIIREKGSNFPSGYGFVYFTSGAVAKSVYENFNGHPIPGTNKVFKLNFATQSLSSTDTRTPANTVTTVVSPEEECSLFVGDLAPDVNDYYLLNSFQSYYPSAFSARVVIDPYSRTPKGYGFVYFRDRTERDRALTEMNGQYISYRPIKVNIATKKEKIPSMPILPPNDPQNTTIFVGGIDLTVTHDVLRGFFKPFGEVKTIKVPVGKGCAFIEFRDHRAAENCLQKLGGTTVIANNHVRVSWGRPPAITHTGEEYYDYSNNSLNNTGLVDYSNNYDFNSQNNSTVLQNGMINNTPTTSQNNSNYSSAPTNNNTNNNNNTKKISKEDTSKKTNEKNKQEEEVTLKKRKVDQAMTEKESTEKIDNNQKNNQKNDTSNNEKIEKKNEKSDSQQEQKKKE